MKTSQSLPTATRDAACHGGRPVTSPAAHGHLVIDNLSEIAAAGMPDLSFCIGGQSAREFESATVA
jgi:hypothetical protein